jgi:hypothetical protein
MPSSSDLLKMRQNPMLAPILNSRYGAIETLAGRPEGTMALIAGGTNGVGEAIMEPFVSEGAQVRPCRAPSRITHLLLKEAAYRSTNIGNLSHTE